MNTLPKCFSLRTAAAASGLYCAFLAGGCGSSGSVATMPEFDPPAMAENAISEADADGDGMISKEELGSMSGLRAAFGSIDKNKDGKLDHAEIQERLQSYIDGRISLQNLTCFVTMKGRPVTGAVVDFIPEEFFGGVIEPAQATTGPQGSGRLMSPDSGLPGIAPGIYRVSISIQSGNEESIPAKYNVDTELGFEVSNHGGGAPARFDLSSK